MLLRSHRFNVLALAAAAALAGCADIDGSQAWFAKPLDIAGRGAGYSFSELAETKKQQRQITPNDLVNANGSCPAPPSAAAAGPPPSAPAANAAAAPAAPPAPAPDATPGNPLLGGGIGLGMSECDVVFRAGPPSSVQLSNAANGDRLTTLTFESGPRPGIYRFVRGSLTEMDAVAGLAAPPPQVAKKKPTRPKKSASN